MGAPTYALLALIVLSSGTHAQRPYSRRGGPPGWWRRGRLYAGAMSQHLRGANISYSFSDPLNGNISHVVGVEGLFAINSKMGNASGRVVHVLTENGGRFTHVVVGGLCITIFLV